MLYVKELQQHLLTVNWQRILEIFKIEEGVIK